MHRADDLPVFAANLYTDETRVENQFSIREEETDELARDAKSQLQWIHVKRTIGLRL